MSFLLSLPILLMPLGADVMDELKRPIPSCYSTLVNASRIVPDLVAKRDVADLRIVIAEWSKFCDPDTTENLLLTRILTDTVEEKELQLNEDQFRRIFSYAISPDDDGTEVEPHSDDAVFRRFITFVKEFSGKQIVKEQQKVNPIFYLLAGDQERFLTVTRANRQTAIAKHMTAYREEIRRMSFLDAALYGGMWLPLGNNRLLGPQPLFGVIMGWGNHYLNIAANLQLRYGKSANGYDVVYDGRKISSDNYAGGYAGLDVTYTILSRKQLDIGITLGIGSEVLSTVDGEKQPSKQGQGIVSANLNLGPSFRYYLNEDRNDYLYGAMRLCYVRYDNQGGTDLTGMTSVFYVGYGQTLSPSRTFEARRVGGLWD